jgi:hypothetical protein
VRLLIADTFATSTYTVPIASGWVSPPDELTIDLVSGLSAAQIEPADAALAPTETILSLRRSHQVLPTIAVIADGVGAVAMRTPVRPDEVAKTPVRLLDAAEGELLARATLRPFYGIEPTAWIHDERAPEAAQAEVVIVAGAEALREPEAGFSEDLARAWFILTALPVVSHLLLLPHDLPSHERTALTRFLDQARAEGLARRREWRPALAKQEGIASARTGAFWSAQRLDLDDSDRQALRELLTRGSPREYAPQAADVPIFSGGENS